MQKSVIVVPEGGIWFRNALNQQKSEQNDLSSSCPDLSSGCPGVQDLSSGSTVEIHGNPLIFGYFSEFLGYFLDFWLNIRVFGQNKVGIV